MGAIPHGPISRSPLQHLATTGTGVKPCWCRSLIAASGRDILHLKALIWADGFDTPFVIHGIQHIIDPPIRLARWTGEDRKSRVVIIGYDLLRDELLDSLKVPKTRPMAQSLPT